MPTQTIALRTEALPVVPRYLVEQAEHAIDRADGKAATLATVAIAILPLVVRGAPGQQPGSAHSAAAALFATGALGWGAGILALAAAIVPRLRRPPSAEERLASFYDFPAELDLERLHALADRMSGDPAIWLLVQGHLLSRIALAKYRLIRIGMSLLGIGGVLGLLGMFAS